MKILIAEDDVMAQVMLKATVAKAGHEPIITGDGLSAYAILSQPDAPKIAILDWMMPGMDGVDVCRKIRDIKTNEPIYIIILTSRTDQADIICGLKAGANDYIVKPYNAEELQARINVGCKVVELQGKLVGQIDELERGKESLQRSEEKYRVIFEGSRDAIMIIEPPSWRFTAGNQAAIEMFKAKNKDEFVSCEPGQLSSEFQADGRASAEKSKEMIAKAMREGSHLFDWTHKRMSGEEFFATTLLSRVEQDEHLFLLVTVRDITERKQAELALLENEKKIEAARFNFQMMNKERKYLKQLNLINRDLHDGIGGLAANIGILAEIGRRQAARETDKKIFMDIADMVAEANTEIRGLMNTLENHDMGWSDWITECRQYGASLMATHRLAFDLCVKGDLDIKGLELVSYVSLSRIFKEALTNVVKHSGADRVDVVMNFSPERFGMSVHDNGRGLDKRQVQGRGLPNMRARAEELGGTMKMRSESGTRLEFDFPIPLKSPE